MFFLDVGLLEGALRTIGVFLCNLIYWLISGLYQLFMTVSRINILSSDEIQPIYERITMILTIVMVFYITFEFVKYVVQPDSITDKEKGVGNITKRMVIVIVLIAFVPKIFTLAYDVQNKLISNQVFSKIILGKTDTDFNTLGSKFSADILGLFYGVNEDICPGEVNELEGECETAAARVEENLVKLREEGKVTLMPGIMKSEKKTIDGETEEVPYIRFDWLLASIVGGFIVYILILYSIDVGTRYAQLIFLQVISPIAIIGYISPKKDGIFQKWLKQCTTTYLDLFIRLAIIYFILLIVNILGDSMSGTGTLFAGLEDVSGFIRMLTYIALVMGLLVFAQKAPKMLQELFPSSGAAGIGYGLEASKRVAPMAARAIGMSAGGLNTLVRKGVARFGKERNRRKEIKDKLMKEGKPTDRKSMRRSLQENRAQERRTNKDLRNKKSELEKASKNLVDAENNLKRAEFSGMDRTSKEYKDLKEARDKAKIQFDTIKTQTASSETKKELKIAQDNLYNAKISGAYNKMSAAEKAKLDNAVKTAQQKWSEEAGYEEIQRAQQQAADKVAEAKKDSYGAPIGLQVAGAAATGLFTGIKVGGQATKLEDIGKKIQESTKQAIEKEKARIEWLESGGGATIDALVAKKITEIQQKFGFETEAERIKITVKELETEVKERDSQISMESNLKKGQDDAEKRAEGKISKREQVLYVKSGEELKYTINNQKYDMITTITDANGNIRQMSTSEIYMHYQEKANAIKAQSEAANAELTKAEMEGRATQDMREKASSKSKEAELAKLEAEQVLKSLKEYAITRAFKGDYVDGLDKVDAVLLNQIEAMKDALRNARNNAKTVQYLRELVEKQKMDSNLFDKFINDEINNFDLYDKIQGLLTGHTGALTLEKNRLNETIRTINENAATAAANANASSSGSAKK